MLLRPAQEQPQQHLSPVLRLGAARPRVDGQRRVARVVRAGQRHLHLERVVLAFELGELPLDVRLQCVALTLVGVRRAFRQLLQVLRGLFKRGPGVDQRLDTRHALHHALSVIAVVPQVGGLRLLAEPR